MDDCERPEPLLLSVNDACKLIACSRPTLYKLLAKGKIAAVRNGGRTLIPMHALRAFAANLPARVTSSAGSGELTD